MLYICNVNKAQKKIKLNIMSFLQIAKALNFTQSVLRKMMSQGLASDKYTFALAVTIQEKFGATQEDALTIIETSLKNI